MNRENYCDNCCNSCNNGCPFNCRNNQPCYRSPYANYPSGTQSTTGARGPMAGGPRPVSAHLIIMQIQ